MEKMLVGERVLITLWVGGMWAIGYMAVPTLFYMLDDRQLAGMLAGQMFKTIYFVGFACALLLLVSLSYQQGVAALKQWRAWILAFTLILITVSLFVIQPTMQDLKAQGLLEGSEQAKQFGKMHGIASAIYLLTSLCGLVLVAAGLRPKTQSL